MKTLLECPQCGQFPAISTCTDHIFEDDKYTFDCYKFRCCDFEMADWLDKPEAIDKWNCYASKTKSSADSSLPKT